MKVKVSRNNPCPCGSGKKYKNCCINKGFNWEVDEQGQFIKSLNSDEIISKLLEVQREKFIKTCSELYDKMMIQLIESVGDKDDYEAFLYAYKKTGRIVTKDNQKYLTDAELKEWDDAIKEYHRLSES